MYLSHSNRLMRGVALVATTGAALITTLAAHTAPLSAQKVSPKAATKSAVEIVSQQVSTARNGASLRLELSDGRNVDVAIRGGQAYLNGKSVGHVQRGGELEQSFRDLLTQITDAQAGAVPRVIMDWSPDASAADEPATLLDKALEDAVRGVAATADVGATPDPDQANALNADGAPANDTLDKLNERISELQSMVDNADEDNNASVHIDQRAFRRGPVRSLVNGFSSVVSTLILYALLFAVAFGVIAFGGRKYIEGVAETARKMTMRSWLVGLAGTFLVFPAYILGILALVISIVGIPVLLAWVPLFPLAVVASIALGLLAVAHAAGESMSEKRFYENDYFQRGNAYYFLLTGLGLLLAPFLAAGVIEMAGPWLGFVRGLLIFLGVSIMWVAFTIGFGAVLVSRGGTRPLGKIPTLDDTFAEDLNV